MSSFSLKSSLHKVPRTLLFLNEQQARQNEEFAKQLQKSCVTFTQGSNFWEKNAGGRATYSRSQELIGKKSASVACVRRLFKKSGIG